MPANVCHDCGIRVIVREDVCQPCYVKRGAANPNPIQPIVRAVSTVKAVKAVKASQPERQPSLKDQYAHVIEGYGFGALHRPGRAFSPETAEEGRAGLEAMGEHRYLGSPSRRPRTPTDPTGDLAVARYVRAWLTAERRYHETEAKRARQARRNARRREAQAERLPIESR